VSKRRLYETAEILVYDLVAENRNGTRASLHSVGFRKVELAASLEALEAALTSRSPDLLLVEVAESATEICALLQSVRQGLLGWNPFIVMVASTWRRDAALVRQILNAGADDLIVRPVSGSQLDERIGAQIERRKRFVVTPDYVGPDRRDSNRPGSECFEVPNPLKLRTGDGLGEHEVEHRIAEEIERGKEMLNHEKLRLDAVQLLLQWRLLEQREAGNGDFFFILSRIEKTAEDIKRRACFSRDESVLGWCDSVIDSINTTRAMKAATDGDGVKDFSPPLHLLENAVCTLARICAPEWREPAEPSSPTVRRPAA